MCVYVCEGGGECEGGYEVKGESMEWKSMRIVQCMCGKCVGRCVCMCAQGEGECGACEERQWECVCGGGGEE